MEASVKPHISRTTTRDDYETPVELFARVSEVFGFDWDLAASDSNHLCPNYYTEQRSFLENFSYVPRGASCWCNPPFSLKDEFLKAILELRKWARHVVFICPNNARETDWWREFVWEQGDEIISLSPRAQFLLDGKRPMRTDAKGKTVESGAGFSCCLIVYRPRIPGAIYGPPRELIWQWNNAT